MKLAKRFALIFVVVFVVLSVLTPIDSTDRGHFRRSGARLLIDDATGCHYLSPFFGGLTPRLDHQGAQICTGWAGEHELRRGAD